MMKQKRRKFAKDATKATQFATNPLGALPKGMDVNDAAAWTVVANVLLNLDEMLMRAGLTDSSPIRPQTQGRCPGLRNVALLPRNNLACARLFR